MLGVGLLFYLGLFLSGLIGVYLNRSHFVLALINIEIMLLSLNIFFLVISLYLDDCVGMLYSFFILTIAASESAIGLAILVLYYSTFFTIEERTVESLKS